MTDEHQKIRAMKRNTMIDRYGDLVYSVNSTQRYITTTTTTTTATSSVEKVSSCMHNEC